MSKYFIKYGFNVVIQDNHIKVANEGAETPANLRMPIRQAEFEGLIKALGVVASTDQLPVVPDELMFTPFMFTQLKPGTFELNRTDSSHTYPITVEYKTIDNFQRVLTESLGTMIDRRKHAKARP